MQLKDLKISKEDNLLTDKVKKHLEDFKKEERKEKRQNKKYDKQKIDFEIPKEQENLNLSLYESWEYRVSKDMTKEIREAEKFKEKLDEIDIKGELIKKNLNNYLNIITKENYEQTKLQILEVIKEDTNYQFIFANILFHKAISERNNIEIYAQLIKELDNELSYKVSLEEGKKKIKIKNLIRLLENNQQMMSENYSYLKMMKYLMNILKKKILKKDKY